MSEASFSIEQQDYLKGFLAGVEARRATLGLPLAPQGVGDDPNDPQRAAQDRAIAAGGTLTIEEQAKRKKAPFDRWDEIAALAASGKFPKGTDVFLSKYFGLFYVAPAQPGFMCRLRIPNGIINSHQLTGLAELAAAHGGGSLDCTTRANLQIREISASSPIEVLTRLSELGLTSRGAGADNIRNVTGSATAGIDPQELLDTRPYARGLHHYILHHKALYQLPRKFNIAYDGGGAIPTLEDTNDISFGAVQMPADVAASAGVTPGVFFQLGLGGITGHKDFARDTGVIVPLHDHAAVANAIVRVWLAQGSRTNRNASRLKYLLDDWGLEKFLAAVETELGAKLVRVDTGALPARPPHDRLAHHGVHAQAQSGLNWIGAGTRIGRLSSEQWRAVARIAERHGSATVRLTVWQNFLISDVPDGAVQTVIDELAAHDIGVDAGHLRAGAIACTGNAGCRFAASDTKAHAADIVEYCERRIGIDQPMNIHLTGCANSCAQHYIADIGLLGVKLDRGEDQVEGYDLHVGGSAGAAPAIGRLIRPGIAAADVPSVVLALLRAWQRDRRDANEGFQDFSARLSEDALLAITLRESVA